MGIEGGRRFWVMVGAALLVGCALRGAIGMTDDAPAADETAYLRSGVALVEGDGFERAEGQPELHFPPFVPFLLGVASEVFDDPHTGTVVWTWITGTAVIVPLALLARRLAGDRAGILTAWVAALAPGLATLPAGRGAGSEAEYALLLVTAIWLVVAATDSEGRDRLLRLGGAGVLVGLAYLTRPEGLFLAVPLALAIVLSSGRREVTSPASLSGVLVFALPVVACVVPYAMFLHDHTGKWQLTAKTQDASIEAWHAVARDDREDRDKVLYGLDDTGLHFTTERTSLTALAREDPSGYARILGSNVRSLGRNVVGWWLLPLPVWGLAVYGVWRVRERRQTGLMLAVAAVPVATALAFFVQPRYLVVTVALATVFAGVGLARMSDRWRRPTVALVGVALAASSVAAFYGDGGWWHPGDHSEQRGAGEWVAAHTDEDDLIMTRSFVVEYYSERPTLAIPYADLDQIMEFGRHYGAQYLVVEQFHVRRLRPQLKPLLEDDIEAEMDELGLELVHEVRAEGRVARVFALDPPPPPTDEIGPSLGFMGDGNA